MAQVVTTQNPVRLQPVLLTGQVTDRGMPEPVLIDSVIVQVDDCPLIHAELTASPVNDPKLTVFDFSATVAIPDVLGPHVITATATDDNGLTATASTTVWVGPPFAIAPAAVLVELNVGSFNLTENTFDQWIGGIQQQLTSIQALAGNYGLNIAGPAITLDESRQVLRIGLWLADYPFGAVPASPPGLPLPSLSETQAKFCFAATPQVLTADLPPDSFWAVSLPTTTLQTLLDAATPAIVAGAAKHNIAVNTLTASTSPPNTVTVTADCTFTGDEAGTVSVTETLGTKMVSAGAGATYVPAVISSTPASSVGGFGFNIYDLLFGVLEVLYLYNGAVAGSVAGDLAGQATGIIGPLLSGLPYAIPFRSTDLPLQEAQDMDFPLLTLDWKEFATNEGGVVGAGGVPSITDRQEDQLVLSIWGPTDQGITTRWTQLEYSWTLENLDPDSFSWTATGDVEGGDIIPAGPFTQSGVFTVPLPPLTANTTLEFTLGVSGSETSRLDPTQVLYVPWSSPITLSVSLPRNPHDR